MRVVALRAWHDADCNKCMSSITLFIDYKSSDAYLSYRVLASLSQHYNLPFDTVPYKTKQTEFGVCNHFDIPDTTNVKMHWKNKNLYLYRIFKMYGKLLGLRSEPVGPKFAIDSTLLLYGNIFANNAASSKINQPKRPVDIYNDKAFDLVWHTSGYPKIDVNTVVDLLKSCEVTNAAGFVDFVSSANAEMLMTKLRSQAEEEHGVFSSPTFIFKPLLKGVYVGRASLALMLLDIHNAGGLSRKALNDNVLTFSFGCHTRRSYMNFLRHMQAQQNDTHILSNRFNLNRYGAKRLDVYIDLKSPYAYLAIDETLQLQADFNIEINWLPFGLNIDSYLGSAEVHRKTNVLKKSKRSRAQWNAVRYAYSNARRYASKRSPSMVILGTYKIWNSSLVGTAILWVKSKNENGTPENSPIQRFFKALWPPFWRRNLDIESVDVLKEVMKQANVDTEGFEEFSRGKGLRALKEIRDYAWNELGIFGVPTYVLNGRILWGREHLDLIRHTLFFEGYMKSVSGDESNVHTMTEKSSNEQFLYGRSLFFDGVTDGSDSTKMTGRL